MKHGETRDDVPTISETHGPITSRALNSDTNWRTRRLPTHATVISRGVNRVVVGSDVVNRGSPKSLVIYLQNGDTVPNCTVR